MCPNGSVDLGAFFMGGQRKVFLGCSVAALAGKEKKRGRRGNGITWNKLKRRKEEGASS